MYLLVVTTWACNLRCTYCKVHFENKYIPEDYLFKAVDLLCGSQDKELKMEFFGGEPLLLPFDLIRRTIEYGERKAASLGKTVKFIMTTNATLLDEAKIAYFKKHDVLLIVSLDGDRRSHNKNRPRMGCKDETYPLVVKNLPMIFRNGLDAYCYTVITPDTAPRLLESFNSLVELGFKKVWIMVSCGPKFTDAKLKLLRKKLKELVPAAVAALKDKGVALLNVKNWLSPMPMNTELSVNIDGNIYSACLAYLVKDDAVRNRYILGHISDPELSIDKLHPGRLSNTRAMSIIYRENNIVGNLRNNVKAGLLFTEFAGEMRKALAKKRLLKKYNELTSDIEGR
ncbi:MAG: radical SAM protein [Elusimicrobia bacterium]|nr:radical SAM protein [Elusimicrobiota bacterium]